MKYLEAILGFLTTIARLFFRGKRKHKPGQPMADDTGDAGSDPSKYGNSTGRHRSHTDSIRETFPSTEKIMGGTLIVCAVGGYVVKLLA